jgi:hypothetical protein
MRMNAKTVIDRMMPGKSSRWGAVMNRYWAVEIIRPHEIAGSWSPTPRNYSAASAEMMTPMVMVA